jgi:hypothetical protein
LSADGIDRRAVDLIDRLRYTPCGRGTIAEALTHLGWRTAGQQPVERYDLYLLAAPPFAASAVTGMSTLRKHRVSNASSVLR